VLALLERRAELVKSHVISAAEDSIADHQTIPPAEQIKAYLAHQRTRGLNATRIKNTVARLKRLATECEFRRLADLDAERLERWLSAQADGGMSAGNRNEYRQELVGFGNWCVRTRRTIGNPFSDVPKADAKSDQRRHRRSLTEVELSRLVFVAAMRPLAEYGRETVRKLDEDRKGRSTWEKTALTYATITMSADRARQRLENNPTFLATLEATGRERALIYKTLILTGLRKAELASLTVGQLELTEPIPFATLKAGDEKNRQGNSVPIRADLANELRDWLVFKREAARATALRTGTPVPSRLPAVTPLFDVPTGLLRILNRDLTAAGIAKRDERSRTVDIHALRHSFGTLLSKGGVSPRTAQAAMRHSTIDLTMNVYTDPKLLDVHGALDALPELSLKTDPRTERIAVRATGTDSNRPSLVAPPVAPTAYKSGHFGSIPVTLAGDRGITDRRTADDENPMKPSEKASSAAIANKAFPVERKGVEPSTSALRTQRSPN